VGDYVIIASGTSTGEISCMRMEWPASSGTLETDEVRGVGGLGMLWA
jgi:hypothetical protein